MQEVVELVVFALIALLVGTGLIWVSGWLLGLIGTVFTWFAGLVWSLLRFLVPVAVVAGLVYLLVQFLSRSGERVARGPQEQPPTPPSPWTMSKDGPAKAGTDDTSGDGSTDTPSAPDDATDGSGSETAAETDLPDAPNEASGDDERRQP